MVEPLRFAPPLAGGLERRSALGPLADSLPDVAPGVRMDEVPFPGLLQLAGQGSEKAFLNAVTDVLGCYLPTTGGTWVMGEGCEVLSPVAGRWLVVVSGGQESIIVRKLEQSFSRHQACSASVSDLSDSQTVFHLYGPQVMDLLEQGGEPFMVPVSHISAHCVCGSFFGTPILLQKLDEHRWSGGAVYRIFVANSLVRPLIRRVLRAGLAL